MGFTMSDFRKVAYGGAIAAPIISVQYDNYEAGVSLGQIGKNVIRETFGYDSNNEFNWAVVSQRYTPVAGIALLDYVTSKLGLQKWFSSRFR